MHCSISPKSTWQRQLCGLQSAASTMRRTMRPVKASLAPTGNRMLDIAIRMAGALQQQEQEAAAAAAAE